MYILIIYGLHLKLFVCLFSKYYLMKYRRFSNHVTIGLDFSVGSMTPVTYSIMKLCNKVSQMSCDNIIDVIF